MSAIEIIFVITIINSFSFWESNTFFLKNIIGTKSHFLISLPIIFLSILLIIFNISNLTSFIYLLCFANLYLIYGNIILLKRNKLANLYFATIIYNFILIFYITYMNLLNFNFYFIKIHIIFSYISYSFLTVTFAFCPCNFNITT